MEKEESAWRAHVLALPFPAQGHINPLLQFSKRLASKELKVTLAIPLFLTKSVHPEAGAVEVKPFSDGCDEGGMAEVATIDAYVERFETIGSRNIAELVEKQDSSRYPFKCLVYDSHIAWAPDLAKRLGLTTAIFYTQACAVDNIYYHVHRGLLSTPIQGPTISVPGLPLLEPHDLPSFVYDMGSYPSMLKAVLNQFSNMDKADWLLFNTFDKLEEEVVKWMAKQWPIRTIGPSVPSMYLDKRVEGDKEYGFNLFKPDGETCIKWLNTKEQGSVVYVSFGSLATLGEDQMEELAWSLRSSNVYFLWVVRASEENKLPSKFLEETSEKGLVITWCPQLDVLAHRAVGCFVTHCGWNSTLEALSLGVPMVAMPQWTDQTTNAKFIEDVWKVGLRVRKNDKGISRREEIELCIREVMQGERGEEIKKNAARWKQLSKEAVDEGGSSDKNIDEFVASLVCT